MEYPQVPASSEIYSKSSFNPLSFKGNYHVKTLEQVYALSKTHEKCQLWSPDVRKKHREQGFNYIHIGLVQVAVKPLTQNGINVFVLLCPHKARLTDYSTSILGIIESNLHNGPIHFDYFPNFTLSLSDKYLLKALTLNIKTSGYEMLEGSQPLALIYRIYYKCIRTNLNVHALVKSPKDQTLLIQSHASDANIRVPKSIRWNEVTLPNDWFLENETQP